VFLVVLVVELVVAHVHFLGVVVVDILDVAVCVAFAVAMVDVIPVAITLPVIDDIVIIKTNININIDVIDILLRPNINTLGSDNDAAAAAADDDDDDDDIIGNRCTL
jgi:hypothetical protein